jgi:AdoMet-dependent heme synthase
MIISWNITKACNLLCEHCYRDAGGKDPQELTTQEGRQLIDEIAKAGFKVLILSGGEPLLRSDVFELVRQAKLRGIRPVLGTNGALFTPEIVARLKDAGVARAGISLDSTDPQKHDEFRRHAGAWQATVNGMKMCREQGLDFQAHTTVTRRNYRDITAITDFVAGLGAKAHHIFFLVPTGRGASLNSVFIGAAEIREVLEQVLKKQKELNIEIKPVCAPQFIPLAKSMGIEMRFQKGCLAGESYCCILPNGDVHPCPYLPLKAGNVREAKFSEIWRNSEIFRMMRTAVYSGNCGRCGHKKTCGGCRARAFHSSGDYMAQDPDCLFFPVAQNAD